MKIRWDMISEMKTGRLSVLGRVNSRTGRLCVVVLIKKEQED